MQVDIRDLNPRPLGVLSVKFSDIDEEITANKLGNSLKFIDYDGCHADYHLSDIDMIIKSLEYIKNWMNDDKE